jgi:hypothetical protein
VGRILLIQVSVWIPAIGGGRPVRKLPVDLPSSAVRLAATKDHLRKIRNAKKVVIRSTSVPLKRS